MNPDNTEKNPAIVVVAIEIIATSTEFSKLGNVIRESKARSPP